MTLDEVKAAAQALLDGINSLDVSASPAPVVAPEDTEVDLVLSDGTVKKFVPAA